MLAGTATEGASSTKGGESDLLRFTVCGSLTYRTFTIRKEDDDEDSEDDDDSGDNGEEANHEQQDDCASRYLLVSSNCRCDYCCQGHCWDCAC